MSDSSDSDSAPAFEVVTAADHAGWLIITSWVFLIFSVFALVAKLIISRFRSAAPGYYDAVLVAATVRGHIAGFGPFPSTPMQLPTCTPLLH